MAAGKNKLNTLAESVKSLALLVNSVAQEKGISYFKLPLLVGLLGAFAMYKAFYTPQMRAQTKLRGDISSLSAQQQHSASYSSYKSQLAFFEKKLPPAAQKNDWLSNAADEVFKSEGIIRESLGRQVEMDSDDIVVAQIKLKAQLPYDKAVRIMQRFENYPLFIKIVAASIKKEKLDNVTLDMDVATVFIKPAQGF